MGAEDRGQKSEVSRPERREEAGKLVAGKWGGMDLTAESAKNAEQHSRSQEIESWRQNNIRAARGAGSDRIIGSVASGIWLAFFFKGAVARVGRCK
jgi:hypothetical protein